VFANAELRDHGEPIGSTCAEALRSPCLFFEDVALARDGFDQALFGALFDHVSASA
jgi:hypothetical protein